jgi:hypothetical protein
VSPKPSSQERPIADDNGKYPVHASCPHGEAAHGFVLSPSFAALSQGVGQDRVPLLESGASCALHPWEVPIAATRRRACRPDGMDIGYSFKAEIYAQWGRWMEARGRAALILAGGRWNAAARPYPRDRRKADSKAVLPPDPRPSPARCHAQSDGELRRSATLLVGGQSERSAAVCRCTEGGCRQRLRGEAQRRSAPRAHRRRCTMQLIRDHPYDAYPQETFVNRGTR